LGGGGLVKRILVIVLAVVVFAGLGYVAASKVWGFPMFGGTGAPKKVEEAKSVMISLGQFMTNLTDHNRYIRVTVDLEVDGSKSEEVTDKTSELKTDVYGLLRSKTYAELTGENGLRNLQKEIKTRLDAKLPGVVRNVFFSEFIVQ
jgi:flagellar basal body-associated protein FliL